MAKFFISYSRSVKDEVRKVVDLLIASRHEVWWDGDIPVMADWWATILDKIEWCEVFIFVASEKSVQSAYCLAELKYASDRQRPILPFMLEDPTSLTLPKELPSRGQWLVYDGDPAQMLSQINTACEKINWALHKDIKVRRPPEPSIDGISVAKQFQMARRLASEKQFEDAKLAFTNIKHLDYAEWGAECDEWLGRLNSYTPVMELVDEESTLTRARTDWAIHSRRYGKEFDPHGIDQKLRGMPAAKRRSPRLALLAIALAVVGIGTFAILSQLNQNPNPEVTPGPTTAVAQISAQTPDAFTPTLSGFQQLQTTEAELTESAGTQAALELRLTEQFISDSNTTATAQMFAVTETAAYATLLALSATPTPSLTPTPTITPSITPDLASTAAAATQAHLAALATLDVQATRSAAITTAIYATADAVATKQADSIPTATDTSTPDPLAVAFAPMTSNADWTLVERDFNGVTMVLVPPGCFTLGSEQGDSDEKPIGQQCIDNYFWLDQTEVTMGQFERLGGYKYLQTRYYSEDLPVRNISWEEARSFCINRRGGRLPSELEWEYAAKGPDNLVFPWGDNWNQHNAVWNKISVSTRGYTVYHGPENVSSIPKNLSWIGAYDMSGNVWEWTNSIYKPYPYLISDGRETWTSEDRRVVRGGSWLSSSGSFLRTTNRRNDHPQFSSNEIGFRCARSYESP